MTGRWALRLVMVPIVALLGLAGLVAHEAQLHQDIANVDVGPIFEADVKLDIASGDCWARGQGDGYPTRVWLLERDAYGYLYVEVTDQATVDAAIEQVLGKVDHGLSPAAFCDGVAL